MGKNQSASNLVNIIQYNNGNISFVSGSTTLMQISSSGAITTTGVISGSNALSASYAATASFVTLAQTASFVTTAQTASFVTTAQTASFVANAQSASNAVAAQTASYANTFTVASTLTAQTLVVQTVTSSIVYSSGSNIFGNSLANTQALTGSVSVTGSLAVVTNGTEFQVTSTGVNLGNALADNHNITGSLRISGSIGIGTSSIKSYSSLTSANQIVGLNNIAVDAGQSFRLNNYYNSGTITDRAISTGHAASFGLDQTNGGITFNISSATASADSNITTTERVRITSAGRVGIGTTNPNSTFHVYGNVSELGIQIAKDGSDTVGGGPYIALQNLANSRQYIMQLGASNDLLLNYWGGSGYNERLRIASGGNVGIGNWASNTPLDRLHVNGAVQIGFVDALNNALRIFWNGASSYGAIQTSSSSNLVLNPSGNNVGIGTTNPANRLHVDVSSNTTTLYNDNSYPLLIKNTSTTDNSYVGMYFGTGLGVGVTIQALYTNASTRTEGNLLFSTRNSGGSLDERMRITSAGRVGIGVTNPTKTFQVNGRSGINTIVSTNLIAGQISGNLNAAVAPNFILVFDMTNNAAGWSLAGTVNAAAWDAWNISTIWIRRLYNTFTVNAGITGLYKSGVDFAICDITYSGTRYIALRFTANPEIDVMWTGYGLDSMFNSDGSVQIVSSGVTVNSIIASY